MYHSKNTSYGDSSDQSGTRLRILSGSAGAGYFIRLGEEGRGLFQCYGGGGYGYSNDRFYDAEKLTAHVSAQFSNVFVQPGIAFVTHHAALSFDVRANYVRVFNIGGYNYSQFEYWDSNLDYYAGNGLYFVNLEPTMTMKAGGQRLKGMVQFGVTVPTVNPEAYFAVNARRCFCTR
jgi:hypothetical protein